MKKVLLVALLLGLCAYVGDAQTVVTAAQLDPNTDAVGGAYARNSGSKDVGDLIYEWSPELLTGDIRCLGVEFDDTNWWVTGAYDMYGAFLYRFDADNTTLLNSYAQGNTGWGWRDIAYDGTYLYCSDSYVIEEVDPATGGVTGTTIASPVSPARALAYDSVRDLFWTGSFSSSIYSVTRGGTSTTYTTILAGTYGAAYDGPTDKVWFWDQTTGNGCDAWEFDPATGTWTGVTWSGATTLGGIAGGACIFDHATYGHVFAGMQQASPDSVSVYELAASTDPQVDIKLNGEDAGVTVNDGDNCTMTIRVEARGMAGTNADIWVLCKNNAGKRWSYNKAAGRWYKGWCTEYVSEPLDDHSETVLDMALPVGMYVAYLGIDTDMNGQLNIGSVILYDMVDFEVVEYFPPLYDNGSTDGTNGYFYAMDYYPPYTNTLLDDFVIPAGETWTINGFRDEFVVNNGYTTGMFIDFLADAGSAPGASVATATGVTVVEEASGFTWFGYPGTYHVCSFDPVVLGAGTYWVEVGPYGGVYQYGMVTSTVTGSELWWRDTGYFGGYFGPGSGQWGVMTDLGYLLEGSK